MATAAEPFTVEHFERWARELVLDNGSSWKLEPFQSAFVADVFAKVPECWLVVPEGNGKTTLVAGLALYHCEFTEEAFVAVAASSRDQAQTLYRQAEGFVFRSGLRGTFKCLEGYRRVVHRENGSRVQVFAADAGTGDGIIPTLAIVDELHRHRSLDLYLTWSGKLDKRAAQVVAISTAGEPGAEFELTREKIRQSAPTVERGETFVRALSETTVMHEWALPEKGDVENLELVKQANPFSGITLELLRKKRARPTMTLAHWRRFTCNLPTRSEDAAIEEAEWRAAATKREIPEGEAIALGADIAWKYDTTAFVPFWMPEPTFRLFGRPTILTPPRDGRSLDPAEVEAALERIYERNPFHTVVMDTHDAHQLAAWISERFGAVVVDRSQTNSFLCDDYAFFMEALRSGWLHHSDDPEFTRQVLNAVARVLPGGQTKFDRPAKQSRGFQQDRRVIDALIAASMVHSYMVAAPAEPAPRMKVLA